MQSHSLLLNCGIAGNSIPGAELAFGEDMMDTIPPHICRIIRGSGL